MSDAAQLRPANENPWYCLATLYGEPSEWDQKLAAKNRIAWNRWYAARLSKEEREELIKNGFPDSDLIPFAPAEKEELVGIFESRIGQKKPPPDPDSESNFAFTSFDRIVSFAGFLFVEAADFSSARFSGDADFGSAAFLRKSAFDRAAFSGYAGFGSVKFGLGADFEEAKFSGHIYFEAAVFSEYANFMSATFSSWATFRSATFFGDAVFNFTNFLSFAQFNSATFSGNAAFVEATFHGKVNFINASFAARTVFADVRFQRRVPIFHGAKLHEATEWHGVTWPSAPLDKDEAQFQVYAYERLKQEMERLKKHEDEQSFFRKELRARRGLVPRWSGSWLLNHAYEISSGFGQSILRPTLWLLALFAVGSAAFVGFSLVDGTRMTIRFAAALSFANIFSFLPTKREIMTPDTIANLSNPAQVVGVVQSLLGIVLLFLLGLALRSRFRMR